jgi:hypothetical protein
MAMGRLSGRLWEVCRELYTASGRQRQERRGEEGRRP